MAVFDQTWTYAVPIAGVAISAAQDLFEIVAPADWPLTIEGLEISQRTEVGDVEDEMLPLSIIAGYSNSGSGGASVTPAKMNPNDPAASFTAERNNTTQASAGTTRTLLATAFNVRAGWFMPVPTYDQQDPFRGRIVVAAGQRLVVSLGAPGDSVTFDATLLVREHPTRG